MKKIMTMAAVVTLGATMVFAGGDWKGGHRGHRGGEFGAKMAQKLNLTDAQKAQIKDIQKNFRETNKAFFESARETMKQVHAAKEANDTAKLDALKPQAEAQRAQMKQLRDAQREKIRSVLTADQRAQLDAMKAQRESRHQQHEQQ